MSTGLQGQRADALELAHHYVGGDGAAALGALLDGFRQRHGGIAVEETQYDSHRLQIKSRILRSDPPDVWTGWPGGEIEGYVDANTVADITDLWEESDMLDQYRPVVADASRVDGDLYAVPVTIHRINDLYVHADRASELGVDPTDASDPAELASLLESATAGTDAPGILLPMSDPFPVLQLWEVSLLGRQDHRTFQAITDGNAAANRSAIADALEQVTAFADLAPDESLYDDLTDANAEFVDGEVPVYPQGDWAAGVFVEETGFEFEREWHRVPFPGTESMYAVVMDAFIPSAESDSAALETFLQYVGSADAQERFARNKGSIPPRKDASMDGFSDFGRDQYRDLDRSREQPQSITHGLSVTPAQLVDLKSAMAQFVDHWDVEATTNELIDVFDGD
ncbi:MAG: ABC transporter substrate-binding protein [Haloarculaceae archaeon]